jgi:hypothetical protein
MRRKIRSSRRGLGGLIIAMIALGVIIFAALFFVPSGSCNVSVTVSMTEVQFLVGSYYSVNSASAVVTGYSPILDLTALFPGGITWPSLSATITLTVSIAGHTASKAETKFLPSLSIGENDNIQDSLTIAYVPQGQQSATAILDVSGTQQGSASTSINVGC